jgi:hypothetical protein
MKLFDLVDLLKVNHELVNWVIEHVIYFLFNNPSVSNYNTTTFCGLVCHMHRVFEGILKDRAAGN